MELAPIWSDDASTVALQVPLLSVQLPTTVVPALKVMVPVTAGGASTYPVGVPPVTVAVKSVDWMELMEVGLACSAVLLVNAVFQSAIRLATLTEPMPVTWS